MATKTTNRIDVNGSHKAQEFVIAPPDLRHLVVKLRGTAPYCQNKFSAKAKAQMKAKHESGSQSRKGKARDPKDYQACYQEALHVDQHGDYGIPAPAFRNAMISACRLCGFKMTHAKLAVRVVTDRFDADDRTPLVPFTKGEPYYTESLVRNETGVADIRPRPMWDAGWEALVTIEYDAGQFSDADVVNLMTRVGMQVGIGEGRPDSKKSAGLGWGLFSIVE